MASGAYEGEAIPKPQFSPIASNPRVPILNDRLRVSHTPAGSSYGSVRSADTSISFWGEVKPKTSSAINAAGLLVSKTDYILTIRRHLSYLSLTKGSRVQWRNNNKWLLLTVTDVRQNSEQQVYISYDCRLAQQAAEHDLLITQARDNRLTNSAQKWVLRRGTPNTAEIVAPAVGQPANYHAYVFVEPIYNQNPTLFTALPNRQAASSPELQYRQFIYRGVQYTFHAVFFIANINTAGEKILAIISPANPIINNKINLRIHFAAYPERTGDPATDTDVESVATLANPVTKRANTNSAYYIYNLGDLDPSTYQSLVNIRSQLDRYEIAISVSEK